jgi:hypothetical protein
MVHKLVAWTLCRVHAASLFQWAQYRRGGILAYEKKSDRPAKTPFTPGITLAFEPIHP